MAKDLTPSYQELDLQSLPNEIAEPFSQNERDFSFNKSFIKICKKICLALQGGGWEWINCKCMFLSSL